MVCKGPCTLTSPSPLLMSSPWATEKGNFTMVGACLASTAVSVHTGSKMWGFGPSTHTFQHMFAQFRHWLPPLSQHKCPQQARNATSNWTNDSSQRVREFRTKSAVPAQQCQQSERLALLCYNKQNFCHASLTSIKLKTIICHNKSSLTSWKTCLFCGPMKKCEQCSTLQTLSTSICFHPKR